MSGYSVKVPAKNIVQLRTIANKLREIVRIKHPYFPIMEFLEFALPRLDPSFKLEVLNIEEMGSNHGLTYPDQNTICLREDIYERAIARNGRDRMTAAHELGHYLLHRGSSFARNMANNGVMKTIEDSEWQAKCFAGELLVPVQDSRLHGLSVDEIADLCGVSHHAAYIQKQKMWPF